MREVHYILRHTCVSLGMYFSLFGVLVEQFLTFLLESMLWLDLGLVGMLTAIRAITSVLWEWASNRLSEIALV